MGVFGRASTSASQKLFSASPAKDEAENTIFFLAFSLLSPLRSCLPNVYENRFNSNDKAAFETKANES
jgi:hypothetical protein